MITAILEYEQELRTGQYIEVMEKLRVQVEAPRASEAIEVAKKLMEEARDALNEQSCRQPPRKPPAVATALADLPEDLARQIMALDAEQAQELSQYLEERYGIT